MRYSKEVYRILFDELERGCEGKHKPRYSGVPETSLQARARDEVRLWKISGCVNGASVIELDPELRLKSRSIRKYALDTIHKASVGENNARNHVGNAALENEFPRSKS